LQRLHQLRAGRDPAVADAVGRRAAELRLAEDEVWAVMEAAQIKAALVARARGAAAGDDGPADQDGPLQAKHAFASERTRLVVVARAFAGPVVAAALADADRTDAVTRR
jgi:hypothetical protein